MLTTSGGEKAVLLTDFVAARSDLLDAVTLVPAEDRVSRAVCGVWTLQDVLGHIAE